MTSREDPPVQPARRPIASRSSALMVSLAARLARTDVSPNQISGMSVIVSALGAALLVWWNTPLAWLLAAVTIQLRLLCNLLDGMVAIEGGKKSAVGALYNEFPDRIADSLLLVAAGHAIAVPALGWCAALLAALTAYVRVFGGSLGLVQDFSGIMAKQRRMALLTGALVLQCVERLAFGPGWTVLTAGLAAIAIGSAVTCMTRTMRIARELQG